MDNQNVDDVLSKHFLFCSWLCAIVTVMKLQRDSYVWPMAYTSTLSGVYNQIAWLIEYSNLDSRRPVSIL